MQHANKFIRTQTKTGTGTNEVSNQDWTRTNQKTMLKNWLATKYINMQITINIDSYTYSCTTMYIQTINIVVLK